MHLMLYYAETDCSRPLKKFPVQKFHTADDKGQHDEQLWISWIFYVPNMFSMCSHHVLNVISHKFRCIPNMLPKYSCVAQDVPNRITSHNLYPKFSSCDLLYRQAKGSTSIILSWECKILLRAVFKVLDFFFWSLANQSGSLQKLTLTFRMHPATY